MKTENSPQTGKTEGLKGEDKVFLLFLLLPAGRDTHLFHPPVDYL